MYMRGYKMNVQLDENGYIKNFVICGESPNCTLEVDYPSQFMERMEFAQAWKYDGEKLVFDETRANELKLERQKDEIRWQRQNQCFPIINRGQLWYSRFSNSELEMLKEWYQEWLDAPETMVVPERPEWLE